MQIFRARHVGVGLLGVVGAAALAAVAVGVVPALAQTAHPPSAAGQYAKACARGNAKYAARDFSAAVALYQAAIELEPQDPLGHYLLGEAQLASGSVAEAEAAFRDAEREATPESDPTMRGRVLFVLADLEERRWKWNDAKAAWQAYLDFAERFADAGVYPASARSRLEVIEKMLAQDRAYEAVRRRIAETKDGGVYSDPSKASPDAAE